MVSEDDPAASRTAVATQLFLNSCLIPPFHVYGTELNNRRRRLERWLTKCTHTHQKPHFNQFPASSTMSKIQFHGLLTEYPPRDDLRGSLAAPVRAYMCVWFLMTRYEYCRCRVRECSRISECTSNSECLTNIFVQPVKTISVSSILR